MFLSYRYTFLPKPPSREATDTNQYFMNKQLLVCKHPDFPTDRFIMTHQMIRTSKKKCLLLHFYRETTEMTRKTFVNTCKLADYNNNRANSNNSKAQVAGLRACDATINCVFVSGEIMPGCEQTGPLWTKIIRRIRMRQTNENNMTQKLGAKIFWI